jgi:hypothetical protein
MRRGRRGCSSTPSGGIALHGYAEVPPYAASHGCVGVPLSEAHRVYKFARLGTPVRVVP